MGASSLLSWAKHFIDGIRDRVHQRRVGRQRTATAEGNEHKVDVLFTEDRQVEVRQIVAMPDIK
jgi:hypothetical protein